MAEHPANDFSGLCAIGAIYRSVGEKKRKGKVKEIEKKRRAEAKVIRRKFEKHVGVDILSWNDGRVNGEQVVERTIDEVIDAFESIGE